MHRRALETFETRNERHAAANALATLAAACALEGRVDEALAMYSDAVSLSHRHGNITDVPWALGEIAALRIEEAPAKTAELLGHADQLNRRFGLAPTHRERALHEATVRAMPRRTRR